MTRWKIKELVRLLKFCPTFLSPNVVERMLGQFEQVCDFVKRPEKSRKLVELKWESNQVWIASNFCPTLILVIPSLFSIKLDRVETD